jgi:hypothetical protein
MSVINIQVTPANAITSGLQRSASNTAPPRAYLQKCRQKIKYICGSLITTVFAKIAKQINYMFRPFNGMPLSVSV